MRQKHANVIEWSSVVAPGGTTWFPRYLSAVDELGPHAKQDIHCDGPGSSVLQNAGRASDQSVAIHGNSKLAVQQRNVPSSCQNHNPISAAPWA
jgi:hypothetical protein